MTVTAVLLALTLGCEMALTNPDGTSDGGSTSASLVTELEPADYQTDTLATGEAVYVDRDFSIQGVPSGYAGWTYVRTANEDKASTSDSAVAFTLQNAATVAVAYDERASTLPDWLQGWTATGDTLRTDDVHHPIFTRDFDAGDVALGGNMSGGAQGANSMYVLFASGGDSTDDGDSGDDGTEPSPSGVPAPDSDDVVYYDMRAGGGQSLQDPAIQNIDDARSMLPNTVFRGMPKEPEFQPYITDTFLDDHPNSELHGTKAFGFPIHQWAGNTECKGNGLPPNGSQQNMQIYPRLQTPDGGPAGGSGETVYVQFKRYFGRTAADQHSSALGPVGDFLVYHTTGGPGGRKWVVWKRPDGSERLDLLKQDFDGDFDVSLANSLNILGMRRDVDGHTTQRAKYSLGQGEHGEELQPWWPDAHFPQRTGQPGGPFTFTLRIKLASAEGAGDGELTYWVDDTIYKDLDGLHPGAVGFTTELELGFPTWICPPQDQTEYFWDVVVWGQR